MAQRVKWKSKIKTSDSVKYKSEIHKVVKKDLIEKGVEYKKSRYIVVDGVPKTVSPEIKGKPPVIKETIIEEGSPYVGQSQDKYDDIEFDVLESELQDYGTVKYYRCEYGKLRIPKNAVYYKSEE